MPPVLDATARQNSSASWGVVCSVSAMMASTMGEARRRLIWARTLLSFRISSAFSNEIICLLIRSVQSRFGGM